MQYKYKHFMVKDKIHFLMSTRFYLVARRYDMNALSSFAFLKLGLLNGLKDVSKALHSDALFLTDTLLQMHL